jgi:hypothetical protein
MTTVVLLAAMAAEPACGSCHEIRPSQEAWSASTHRSVACAACHGSGFTTASMRHIVIHAQDRAPEQIRIPNEELAALAESCRACHRQEFSDWATGPHGATYGRLFLDEKHNRQRLLIDDCLRCHGMHFQGGIGDLVTPLATSGPWRLRDPDWTNRPAMPCLACHQMHREGQPLAKSEGPAAGQELYRPSLALFDRRSQTHIPLGRLGLPAMLEGLRLVKMSPDARQALCYQCHAPGVERQVRSGDDRTPVGVHEGISCLACHLKHSQQTRASCATCHPRWSNCGREVETMDTTFRSPESRHNIHFVKCGDCHPKGVPPRRLSGSSRGPARGTSGTSR